MTKGEIVIKVESDISEYVFESLEEDIRNLLESQGIKADILDSATGNAIRTRKGMMGKSEGEFADQNIRGELILGEKIWFNDDLRCRLRICGWTIEQIEKLRTAKLVDLTLTDFRDEDMPGVAIRISEWGPKDKRDIEELCK